MTFPRCLISTMKKETVIEFEEFMHALSIFHPYASLEKKIDCKTSVSIFKTLKYYWGVGKTANFDELMAAAAMEGGENGDVEKNNAGGL
ncbi:Calcineurin B-like protein [Arachis hypogaea]|nr:Calcineurin B-like protein [Arachis hypogaea]